MTHSFGRVHSPRVIHSGSSPDKQTNTQAPNKQTPLHVRQHVILSRVGGLMCGPPQKHACTMLTSLHDILATSAQPGPKQANKAYRAATV